MNGFYPPDRDDFRNAEFDTDADRRSRRKAGEKKPGMAGLFSYAD